MRNPIGLLAFGRVFLLLIILTLTPHVKANNLLSIVDIELGLMANYLDYDSTRVNFADQSFLITHPLLGSAYIFAGYEFLEFSSFGVAVEGMGIIGLLDENSTIQFDDKTAAVDVIMNYALGAGLRGSFETSLFTMFVRGGFANHEIELYGTSDSFATTITATNKKSIWDYYVGTGIIFKIKNVHFTGGYYFMPGINNAHVLSIGVVL